MLSVHHASERMTTEMASEHTGVPTPDGTAGGARPFRRRLVLNTLSTAAGNSWAMVVMLVSLPLLLRGLGTEAFGLWVLLQTFSAVTGWLSLADLGIGMAMTRQVASSAAVDDHAGTGRAIGSGLATMSVIGLSCAVVLAVLGPLLLPAAFRVPPEDVSDFRVAVVVYGINVVAELLTRAVGAALEGLQRVDLSRGADAIRRTVAAMATIAVAIGGGGLIGVVIAQTAASAAAAAVAVLILRREILAAQCSVLAPSWSDARQLLRYGSTVGALNATGVVHRVMDRLIIGSVFGPRGVTLIEVATQIQNGATAILSATSYAAMSSSPWLHARQDEASLRALVIRGTRYSLLATLPVVVLAAVLARPIVRTWVGARFDEAAGLAVVALLYVALAAPMQVGQNVLQGIGRASLVLRAAAIAVAVNLVASVVLARAIGLVGVLIGTLIGVLVLTPALVHAVTDTIGTPLRTFIRDAIAPAVGPTMALGAAAGTIAFLLEGHDVTTIVAAATAGLAVFVPLAIRYGLESSDRTDLFRRFRR